MSGILRIKQTCKKLGLSESTIRRQLKAGTFPQLRTISPKCVGFIESEIADWISAREIKQRQPAFVLKTREK